MKKLILTVAGSLLISLAAVNAQQDTTQNRKGQSTTTQRKTTRTQTDTKQQDQTTKQKGQQQSQYGTQTEENNQWRTENSESLMRDDLPEALVETLNSDEYQGWENATIYRNKSTSEYMLVLSSGDQPKTFYFDKEGKAVNSVNQYGTSGTQDQRTQGTQGTQDQPTYGTQDQRTQGTQDQRTQGTQGQRTQGTQDQRTQTQGTQDQQIQWRTEERVEVTQSQIPSSLRVTLKDDRYKGWEKSKIYRNRKTNEYMVEIDDGTGTTTSKKTYYFDKDGKAMKNNNSSSEKRDY